MKDKKYCKVRGHCHYTGKYRDAAHSISSLKYSVPKKIRIGFHNGSNYDYHFTIKGLTEEFIMYLFRRKQEKYVTFTVPIEKELTRIDKWRSYKNISYILQFIDSTIFMVNSLSNLANTLAEGINEIKSKYRRDDKNCETCGIIYKYCDFLNTQTSKVHSKVWDNFC